MDRSKGSEVLPPQIGNPPHFGTRYSAVVGVMQPILTTYQYFGVINPPCNALFGYVAAMCCCRTFYISVYRDHEDDTGYPPCPLYQ